MGLDVYLYYCKDAESAKKHEAAYQKQLDAMKPAPTKEEVEALTKRLGLTPYGEWLGKKSVEFPSTKYPDHLFKVGYFRSSYNPGGYESVVERLGVPEASLSFIFNTDNQYYQHPYWIESLGRCKNALTNLCGVLSCEDSKYDITFIEAEGLFGDQPTLKGEQAAKQICMEEMKKVNQEWGGWSNKQGHFWSKGLEVVGILPGKATFSLIGKPRLGVYVVYKMPADTAWAFYSQALEIVLETIQYVLAQPDPENYYLAWSG